MAQASGHDINIGSRLKRLRKRAGLSQRELANKSGVTNAMISLIETDRTNPSGGRISYRQVGADLRGRTLQILHERLKPSADTGKSKLRHDAQEGGMVLKGRVELTVGTQKRVLRAGDAYCFDSRVPHRFCNVGEDKCEIVSACTPPSFSFLFLCD